MYNFTGEEKLEVCMELAEDYFILAADPEIQELQKSGKPVISYVEPALRNHRAEALKILARLQSKDGVTVDEYLANTGTFAIAMELTQIFTSPEFVGLFSSQSQKAEGTSSGSATESTEVDEH